MDIVPLSDISDDYKIMYACFSNQQPPPSMTVRLMVPPPASGPKILMISLIGALILEELHQVLQDPSLTTPFKVAEVRIMRLVKTMSRNSIVSVIYEL